MSAIDLGPLAQGPHANLIRAMASTCAADGSIHAMCYHGIAMQKREGRVR